VKVLFYEEEKAKKKQDGPEQWAYIRFGESKPAAGANLYDT